MKLLWSKSVPVEDPWEPALAGVFCRLEEKVHFLYMDGGNMAVLTEDSDRAARYETGEKALPLPNRWILCQNKILLSEELLFDISRGTFTDLSGTLRASEYSSLRKPEKYYVEATFAHNGYEISHKGNFGYQCTKSGRKIWEFRGQGYLYTDICFWKNRVFFGTAGQGGYFYVLDLQTGEVLRKIKTGGTASFAAEDHCCYVLTNENNAKLLCVDLTDGSIRDELALPGSTSVYSRLYLNAGKLHAVTFSNGRKQLQGAFWNCAEIGF